MVKAKCHNGEKKWEEAPIFALLMIRQGLQDAAGGLLQSPDATK